MENSTERKSKTTPIKGIGTLVREGQISFVRIDRGVFEKTESERQALKRIINKHNRLLRSQGLNPKKFMNVIGTTNELKKYSHENK